MRDAELQAEEEQTFLARQQQQLLSSGGASPGPAGAPRPDTPSRLSTSGVQKTPERRGTASPSLANNSSVGKKVRRSGAEGRTERRVGGGGSRRAGLGRRV